MPLTSHQAPTTLRYTNQNAYKLQNTRTIKAAKQGMPALTSTFKLQFDHTKPSHVAVFMLFASVAFASVVEGVNSDKRTSAKTETKDATCSLKFGVTSIGGKPTLTYADGRHIVSDTMEINENCTIFVTNNTLPDGRKAGGRLLNGDVTIHIIDSHDNCCSAGLRVNEDGKPAIVPALTATKVIRNKKTNIVEKINIQPNLDRIPGKQCKALETTKRSDKYVVVIPANGEAEDPALHSRLVKELSSDIGKLEAEGVTKTTRATFNADGSMTVKSANKNKSTSLSF